jgi:hypothetical protein
MLPCMLLISAATMHTETVFGKWLPTAGVPWSFDVFENDMFFLGGGGWREYVVNFKSKYQMHTSHFENCALVWWKFHFFLLQAYCWRPRNY